MGGGDVVQGEITDRSVFSVFSAVTCFPTWLMYNISIKFIIKVMVRNQVWCSLKCRYPLLESN